jgi:hypothetical protein
MGKFINSRKVLWMVGFAVLLIAAGCNAKKVESLPLNHAIKIDGNFDDWKDVPIDTYDDNQVGMSICNDDENLYILFRFQNHDWARVIRRTGLTLWIDQKGGKDKVFGINYNGGPSQEEIMANLPDEVKQRMENMSEEQRARMEARMRARPVRLEVIDNRAEQVWPLDSMNKYGLEVKYGFVDGFYTYEARIPLKIISADFYGIEIKPGQEIALGAEWGGFGNFRGERPERPEGGGFSDRPPGERRGGGMGRHPGGMRPNIPEKQEIWIKADLAASTQTNKKAE